MQADVIDANSANLQQIGPIHQAITNAAFLALGWTDASNPLLRLSMNIRNCGTTSRKTSAESLELQKVN